MPAYVIVETDVTDPEQYEQYKAASPGAIAAGGRFLARGGELAVLEGDWQPSRLVVLEFEDLAAVKRWYQSEAYQEAKKLREGAAHLPRSRRAGPRLDDRRQLPQPPSTKPVAAATSAIVSSAASSRRALRMRWATCSAWGVRPVGSLF